MDYTIMIVQFFLSLSILVILHEMGHFFPARWFKTRVEKFYLFFDPWFSLFKKKVGDTEYGVGWLPLGGYVKIAGMIDESMDKEQMAGPPQPWEFRSKPAWQRLIIMLGGVIVNFLLGFLIFGLILWYWGESYIPADEVEYGIYVDSIGHDMGLRDGDQIISIGGEPFERFDSRVLLRAIVLDGAEQMTVKRNNREMEIPIDNKYVTMLSSNDYKNVTIFGPRMPAVVNDVMEGAPAEEAGIQQGDRFIGVNGQSTPYLHDFSTAFSGGENKAVDLTILREGDTMSVDLTTSDKGLIGVYWKGPQEFFDVATNTYPIYKALPMGVAKGYNFLADQIIAFGKMFSGEIKASESLGGFGTITQLFPTTWDWQSFWRITAILSLILGFMNLLPIPALDGGHVMFLIYEVVTGKKPSDKFMEYATIIGFAIVLGLVIYANGLDVWRWWNG
ncbi:MAG: RIP metalloprotease RseP [Saprospiraceae bacterium]|nr:RIP metalloprotease RseP [Saprospiraceae bacterium]